MTATIATTWAEAAIALAVVAAVTALVLLVVWQIFAVVKKGMDRSDGVRDEMR